MHLFRKKTKPTERRSHFRNKIPGNDFEATLRQQSGAAFHVAIVELSGGGGKVRLNPRCGESLRVEELVILELIVSNPGRQIRLCAGIRRIEEGCVYLEFSEPNLDEIPLDAESRMLLSRRKFPRHRLQEHVLVELTISSVVVTGVLTDISEGGMGLNLQEDLAGTLSQGDSVEVEFHLPGVIAPCSAKARVRHRTPRAGSLYFGLSFAPERFDELNPVLDYLAQAKN